MSVKDFKCGVMQSQKLILLYFVARMRAAGRAFDAAKIPSSSAKTNAGDVL